MALTNFALDQLRPARMGNTSQGLVSGTVASSASMNSTDYQALIVLVAPHFINTPRVALGGVTTGTTYAFIATGRAF